jgi:hypothetical protein
MPASQPATADVGIRSQPLTLTAALPNGSCMWCIWPLKLCCPAPLANSRTDPVSLICLAVSCLQEKRTAATQYQAQVLRQKEQARQSALKVTQLAKADLQALKQRQDQERQQAAAMHTQMKQW